jgi:hypothetical protein
MDEALSKRCRGRICILKNAPQGGYFRAFWRLDESSPIIRQSKGGDVINAMIHIASSGGHRLWLREFTLQRRSL